MLTASLGSILYRSLTSVLRYVYVRSSLVEPVQHILKKDSFKIQSIAFAESLLALNVLYLYSHTILTETPRPPFVLYEACLNPWGQFDSSLLEVTPIGQFMINLINATNIICNLCVSSNIWTEKPRTIQHSKPKTGRLIGKGNSTLHGLDLSPSVHVHLSSFASSLSIPFQLIFLTVPPRHFAQDSFAISFTVS